MEQSQESERQRSGQHGPPIETQEVTRYERVKNKCMPGVKITLLISLIFYIAAFAIGIWGINKCPAEENVPFFLIVLGGIGVISKTASIIRDKLLEIHPKAQFGESALYTVELVFILLGSFWVFKIYPPNYDQPLSHNYCNKTVYIIAFSYLVALYSVILFTIIGFACFLGCMFFVASTSRQVDEESQTEPMRS
ncbi:transmembrane protein 272-like [Sitophilus oryzae]|uniref:Transmembrane protein 272-like n=1 Tax=Sitophilus oryzae TaxID=7048 RepID=A0A6J2Y236_SITOR|nr:transmembrane protein 272-like [Sitophilus oryzae]